MPIARQRRMCKRIKGHHGYRIRGVIHAVDIFRAQPGGETFGKPLKSRLGSSKGVQHHVFVCCSFGPLRSQSCHCSPEAVANTVDGVYRLCPRIHLLVDETADLLARAIEDMGKTHVHQTTRRGLHATPPIA